MRRLYSRSSSAALPSERYKRPPPGKSGAPLDPPEQEKGRRGRTGLGRGKMRRFVGVPPASTMVPDGGCLASELQVGYAPPVTSVTVSEQSPVSLNATAGMR